LVRHLPKEVRVHSASGIVRDGVGVFHGHRWPSRHVFRARHLVTGHLHPGFRFAATPDHPSTKQRCWVHVEYPPEESRPRRRSRGVIQPLAGKELTVLPAFNPLTGTESLNVHRPKRSRSFLFQRFLAPGAARAFLLDGTDLGVIPTPVERSRRRGSPPKGRPAS
jgi:metallophosphoesterase superfamily enzyme